MKLYCLFLSFAIVNVLAVTETDYKKQVYISNNTLQSVAQNAVFVDDMIETLLCSNIPIVSMALMLVAPENTTSYDSDYLEQLIVFEKQIQNKRITRDTEQLNARGIDFGAKSLPAMGITRRNITYPSLKRLLYRVDRGLTTELNALKKCYLIALLKTGSDRRYRIKEVSVDDNGDCRLVGILDIVSIYRKFDDGFYKIAGPTFKKIVKLTNEIS